MKKNSSECKTENSDNLTKGLKISRLKHAQNPIIAQININFKRNKIELTSYTKILQTN